MRDTTSKPAIPRPEFPRPDMERRLWMSLNGEWDFAFDDSDSGLAARWYASGLPEPRKILVPFCYQSEASGIGLAEPHEVVWYSRSLEPPPSFRGRRTLLKFGAVDYSASVWVNGELAATHEGGHTPFYADVTRLLVEGTNAVVVRAEDREDPVQPRGKQSWRKGEHFGCWYLPTTGIWQSVWIESVGAVSVERFRVATDSARKSARVEAELDGFLPGMELRAEASFKGRSRASVSAAIGDRSPKLTIDFPWLDELDGDFQWKPGSPNLFDLELSLVRPAGEGLEELDRVEGYFGFRTVEAAGADVLLNGVPFVQKLVLDQGYWEESLLTPPSDEAIRRDIELAMSFGFNGARKHQKIEDPRYYYWADRLGFVVWGEMPSNYGFAPRGVKALASELLDFIERDYNHPSIIAWVPLNESWGVADILADEREQRFSLALYNLAKSADGTRLVSSNDGWEQTVSDLCAIHDYEASGERFARKIADWPRYLATKSDWRLLYAKGYDYRGEPVLLTEYGGIAFAGGRSGEWGYHEAVADEREFLERFGSMTRAVLDSGRFAGLCYTQLTDVQQEVNGLCGPDRSPKVDPAAVRAILDR
jgi:beta-galactosidase/beta-glucuronidase